MDRNTRNRERYHEKRKRVIAYLGGKCVECGTTKRLEVHHVVRGVPMHVFLTWRWERILPELEKCELRCRPHHHRIPAR